MIRTTCILLVCGNCYGGVTNFSPVYRGRSGYDGYIKSPLVLVERSNAWDLVPMSCNGSRLAVSPMDWGGLWNSISLVGCAVGLWSLRSSVKSVGYSLLRRLGRSVERPAARE